MRLVLPILLAMAGGLSAQEPAPRAIVEAFFSPQGIRDKRAVYTGDMLSFLNQRTLGQELDKNALKTIRPLSESDAEAIFAVEVTHEGATQDWYAFLHRSEGVWRLTAVRSMRTAGMSGANAGLLAASDAQRRAYLREHLPEFDALASALTNDEDATEALRGLGIAGYRQTPAGTIEFILGRSLNNTVGYLYLPDGVAAPRMSPDQTMYIEHIEGRWYSFKTT